jgi:hypothetical protein
MGYIFVTFQSTRIILDPHMLFMEGAAALEWKLDQFFR